MGEGIRGLEGLGQGKKELFLGCQERNRLPAQLPPPCRSRESGADYSEQLQLVLTLVISLELERSASIGIKILGEMPLPCPVFRSNLH